MRTGKPQLIARITDQVLSQLASNDDHLAYLRELGMHSAMVLPLTARGRTLGAITLITAESGRTYDQHDLIFSQEVAGRLALALDNARLFDASRRAVKLREKTLALVSHDLRSPLSVIGLSADMLRRRLNNESLANKQLQNISCAVSRMDRLISDLLDMASIQTGSLRIEWEERELAPFLEEMLELHRDLAAKNQIELHDQVSLPHAARACADYDRLGQALTNLLGNAIKFTPAGGKVELYACEKQGSARIEIHDTGPASATKTYVMSSNRIAPAKSIMNAGPG
nr:HAMP domain-containing sensor histidine kinase [Alkalilimnicola ehrlichii]